MDILLTTAPFVLLGLIMMIANVAESRRQRDEPHQTLAFLAYIPLILIYGAVFAGGLILQTLAARLAQDPELTSQIAPALPGIDPAQMLGGFGLYGPGIWIAALVGIALLALPVRRLLATVIPIDPANPVHAVALSYTMLVVINLLFTLGAGLGNLASAVEQQTASGEQAVTLSSLWLQQILTALLAIVGVGWLIRRDWANALQRLGIVRPTLRQVLIGIGIGLLMVPVVLVFEQASQLVDISFDPAVERLTEQLLGPLFKSAFGILTIGLAAALGEETLLRGAVQPRFGLVLTALIFALLHSTYGLSLSTVIVFILGLVLGLVRMRSNTTTAMIVHAIYNMTLGLMAYLNLSF